MLLSNRNVQKKEQRLISVPRMIFAYQCIVPIHASVQRIYTIIREHIEPGNPLITETNNILYLVKVLHSLKSK